MSFFSQRAELTSDKDMYLDNSSTEEASGAYPIDDDDYSSASGSGKSAWWIPFSMPEHAHIAVPSSMTCTACVIVLKSFGVQIRIPYNLSYEILAI